jgi:AcrR family transcriptional regulator
MELLLVSGISYWNHRRSRFIFTTLSSCVAHILLHAPTENAVNREKLLAVALELMEGPEGVDGVTMRGVAASAV